MICRRVLPHLLPRGEDGARLLQLLEIGDASGGVVFQHAVHIDDGRHVQFHRRLLLPHLLEHAHDVAQHVEGVHLQGGGEGEAQGER